MEVYKRISLRLNEKQYKHLKKQAEIAGFKMEPFLRMLIEGEDIKPHPPEAYRDLLRELSAIGNNINQIAWIANAQGTISWADHKEACRLVGEAFTIIKGYF